MVFHDQGDVAVLIVEEKGSNVLRQVVDVLDLKMTDRLNIFELRFYRKFLLTSPIG